MYFYISCVKKQFSLKKLLSLLAACSLQLIAFSQYWQQKVDFTIDVTLNDNEKTLNGFAKITYYNNSPDTLEFIWFHLWPNAYKNDKTAFSDQLLENGNTNFYFSSKEEKGYINRLDFKVNGATAKTEDHPQHIDIIKLILQKPLLPGKQVLITTSFHVKLPFNFSRGGYDSESFQITQWYPKPAVYDKNGWHPMPYLDQGEFYSEFGTFDVRITLPKKYIVAATGEEVNADVEHIDDSAETKASNNETKAVRFKQSGVHDFAWFADKHFIVKQDTCALSSGKVIQVFSYYTPAEEKIWKNSIQYAKDAMRFYSTEIGEYPYNVVSVVQGPQSFGGGMEYPTITVIAPTSSPKELDITIAHELGHSWFYGILASNERNHPWMDEGLNSFYEQKYTEAKYGKQRGSFDVLYQTRLVRKTAQPIETSSPLFTELNYFLAAYFGTAAALRSVEEKAGKENFKKLMQKYYEEWKFRHPQPEDLKKIFGITDLTHLIKSPKNGFKIVSPFKKGFFENYLNAPVNNTLLLSPSIGANLYDGTLIGGLISNYKLPPNKFQFLLIPMYGLRSKKFAGLGKLNYTIMSDGAIRKTDIFLNASKFSMDDFKDSAGRKLIMQYQKLVPGFKLNFDQKDPKSTVNRFIQWKTFLFKEQSLRIIPDTIFNGADTTLFLHYLLPANNRYLNQLQLVYENYRGLYPFKINLQIEQGKDFIRPALTANYFFNYKDGGLAVRFFAGKFIYLNGKTFRKQFANDRYNLNMTGPNGYEDYTYSDYFLGRNEFEGTASQQIMMRDGGFKVRTDLLASKIGKTDEWLTAVNFSASLPKKLNPLSVLPIKIPLNIFLDIGTYAGAWNRNADADRFLFDAGLHLPLFDEAINIYIPVFYNKVYSDYYKSTIPKNRFLKTISFTVNFYTKAIAQMNRNVEF